MTKLKHTKEIVDTATGELITVEKSFSVKTNTDKFFMVFIEHIAPLLEVRSITDRKVLDVLCRLAEYNTGKVSITSQKRKDICDEIQVELQTFSNSLNRLKSLGLIWGKAGDYEINPIIFWKGSTDARAKLLKERGLTITFGY
jgi:hypothetical protein